MSSSATIFLIYLRLGCLAFGGPVAHLGWFEREFVEKRRWISAEDYADLLALTQVLPGPASSQVGYAIGLMRGGWRGGAAAWLGFTLPSALLMLAWAWGLSRHEGVAESAWVHGLKLAALAVVVNALWDMARKLLLDLRHWCLALATTAFLVVGVVQGWSLLWLQLAALASGALIGLWLLQPKPLQSAQDKGERARSGGELTGVVASGGLRRLLWLSCAALLSVGLASSAFPGFAGLLAEMVKAGVLVFGGGHVVLPLIESGTVGRGWVGGEEFIAGYGAAQTLPGPLFSFSTFLGASASVGPGGVLGGLAALAAIFLPSWLLVPAVLPRWDRLRRRADLAGALGGLHGVVVGLLAAALYSPVGTAALRRDRLGDVVIAAVAFVALRWLRVPAWAVVGLCALAAGVLG